MKLKWKREPGMPGIQAPISHGGKTHDYVISHRHEDHTVSFRPPGEHHHVGSYRSEHDAKAAAEQHAKTGTAPPSNTASSIAAWGPGGSPSQPRGKRQHATTKTPSQLDREIAEALGKKRPAHATRATPYRIKLTPSEMRAVEFARGRYAWPDMLSAHAAEDGSVAFTESEMWQWADDVDSDAEGGHDPFPLASPAFADKLQRFYDERV